MKLGIKCCTQPHTALITHLSVDLMYGITTSHISRS